MSENQRNEREINAPERQLRINRDNYMTTGEFAKAMGVTKNTLFHYDRIGLFSPEIVLDNDYRYYSIYQMEFFHTILILKDFGMSLTQIREFLEHRSPEQLLSAFKQREKQIDLQIKNLREQKRWIEEQQSRILEVQKQDWNRIYVKHFPLRYFLYMPVEEQTDSEFYHKTNEIITAFWKNNPEAGYDVGYLQRKSDLENHIYDNYHNILLITSKKPSRQKYYLLQEGDYLVGYHRGHWETIGTCYERLFSYAEEHNLLLEDFSIEYNIVDGLTVEKIEDYVTEVSVRICKRETST